jgi:hypothetical protein
MNEDKMEQLLSLFKSMIKNNVQNHKMLTGMFDIIRDLVDMGKSKRVGTGGGIQFILDCIEVDGDHGISFGGNHEADILHTLEMLFKEEENVLLFIELKGFKRVHDLLWENARNKNIVLAGFRMIGAFISRDNSKFGTDSIRLVLRVLRYHTDDLDVMKAVFLTMQNIGFSGENMRYFIVDNGALRCFLRAIKAHQFDRGILRIGLSIVKSILDADINHFTCLIEHRCQYIDIIKNAMLKFNQDEGIQYCGMRILSKILRESKNSSEFCREYGVDSIKFLLDCVDVRKHPGIAVTSEKNMDVLITMDKLFSNGVKYFIGNMRYFIARGGVELVEAMADKWPSKEIQISALTLMDKLTKTKDTSIGKRGALPLVLKQFDLYNDDLDVMKAMFVTMDNIGYGGGNIEWFNWKSGELPNFLDVMEMYPISQVIQEHGVDIVSAVLDYDKDNMKTLLENNSKYLGVITKPMVVFPKNRHLFFTCAKIMRHALRTNPKLRLTIS